MQKLLTGVRRFQTQIFSQNKQLFTRLAGGQTPTALFITCADSRINPNLLTQTDPGDIFVLRNAGNIVPPHPETGGELATIEFAIRALRIRDIVICGHSDCGAVKGLLGEVDASGMPALARWLTHAERTTRMLESEHCIGGDAMTRLMTAIERNVLVQLENLRSHPVVADAIHRGELNLHGWVYRFENGQVLSYEERLGTFVPLGGRAQ